MVYSQHKPENKKKRKQKKAKKKKKRNRKKERMQESAEWIQLAQAQVSLLSFLLGSPVSLYLIYLCFFFLSVFSQTHVWMFTKPTTMRHYMCTLLQTLLRGR